MGSKHETSRHSECNHSVLEQGKSNEIFIQIGTQKKIVNISFTFRFLMERGSASTPKMEYQVLSCIFHCSLAMATLGLKEMGKFLWEGREKGGKRREKERA